MHESKKNLKVSLNLTLTVSNGKPTTNEQMPPNPPASKFALGLKRILSRFAL